jgi:shikimate dehydrogenase
MGPAVVLGAGGAARAVVAALIEAGTPDIRVVNRSMDRAGQLVADLGSPARAIPWDERAAVLADAALLVNTTILGMAGAPPLDLDLSRLPVQAVVNDVVYVPLETDLLAAARDRGNPVVDGLGMLLWQAVSGFERWFGQRPEVTEALRRYVLS